jgi:hypothetical protein
MFQFRRFFLLLFEPDARNPIIIGHGKPQASKIFDMRPVPNSLTPQTPLRRSQRATFQSRELYRFAPLLPCHRRRWQRFCSSPRQAKNEGQIASAGEIFFQLTQSKIGLSSGLPGLPTKTRSTAKRAGFAL